MWRYDDLGRETEIIGPDGARLVLTHGPGGLERAIDAAGAEWTWTRDANSLLTKVLTPGREVIEIDYERGLPTVVRSSGGRQVRAEYDEQLNVAALQMENGAEARYWFDELGRLRQVIDPCGAVVRLQYDTEGRTIRIERASGAVEELVWNSEGDLLEFRDPTRFVRYRIGNMHRILEREEAGATQRLEFDTEGRLTASVDEADQRYEFRRNEAGYIVRELGFDGVEKVYARDLIGRVTEVRWPSGRHSQMKYDAAGRTIRTSYSDGDSIEMDYSSNGAIVMAKTASTVVKLVRDEMQRPVREFQQSHERQYTISSDYGPDGLRSGLTSSLGAAIAWSREAFGLVSQIFLGVRRQILSNLPGPQPDARFERDLLGRTLAVQWLDGIRVEWARDITGRPGTRHTLFDTWQIDSRYYTWHGQDRIISIAEASEGVTLWQHDDRGRLIGMAAPNGQRKVRALDVVGNVYRRPDLGDRNYAPGGRLLAANGTTFKYDADGWLAAKLTAAGDWHYKWNGAGRLERVQGPSGLCARFEYDAFARRTRKTTWRRPEQQAQPDNDIYYVWDGDRLLHEIPQHGSMVTWHWDPDGLTPIIKEVCGRRWIIISDHLGTPTEMYYPHGALAWKAKLDPTGLITVELGAPEDCPWRWRGQYADRETGLYYNRHRYYDPELGRYLSPDPSGLRGGLHPYAYVDDPLVEVDPFGLHVVEGFLDGIAVINPSARSHPTWWRNLTGSAENGMAENGFGRAGDSENRLMEYLEREFEHEGLQGKTLEIHSLGEPGMGWGPLRACEHCDPGMQNFANEMEMTIIYHGPEGSEKRYTPCGT
jgi:RHS repeat-associated protein